MCGVAGFMGTCDGDPVAILDEMLSTIAHRGPDDVGTWHEQQTHLGMTRLAIIDLVGGAQPMHLEDDSAHVVMNGELYNHVELRRILERKGHRFATSSDTEVLLRGYAEWGTGVFERLDGMFATAIFDSTTSSLLLARDRFGEKPLFVWDRPSGPAFASEPKAFRSLGPLPAIDEQALAEYLHLGYVPAPRTIWDGIRKLSPAEVAVFRDKTWVTSRFWSPEAEDESEGSDATERLRDLLLRSVESRLVADVEVGVLLSGGIDSSLVAWAAAACRPGIRTFTVGFDDPTKDESGIARATSAALGTQHVELRVSAADALVAVDRIPSVYDEPFADSSAIPTMLLCEAVSEHVKVALCGDGGDELFSGYPRYDAVARATLARILPPFARGAVMQLATSPSPFLSRLGNVAARRGATAAANIRLSNAILPEPLLDRLLGRPVDFAALDAQTAAQLERFGAAGHRAADIARYLPDDLLVKMDRASMAASLEVRVPFLHPDISHWALGLPASALGPPGAKSIPRALARQVLPTGLAEMPKRGFSVPLASWLRGPLADTLAARLDPTALDRTGMFNPKVVALLLERLRTGRQGVANALWALFMYQQWEERQ